MLPLNFADCTPPALGGAIESPSLPLRSSLKASPTRSHCSTSAPAKGGTTLRPAPTAPKSCARPAGNPYY